MKLRIRAVFKRNKAAKRLSRLFHLYTKQKGCYDCGNKKLHKSQYEFDHIDGSTNKSRTVKSVAGIAGDYSLKTWFKEIRKTHIVCANCHNFRGFLRGQKRCNLKHI
jgi:hypothetical protein